MAVWPKTDPRPLANRYKRAHGARKGVLAEAGTARPERGLEHDLDRLRRDRSRQPREDAEFGALVLVRQLVPPRQPIELAHVYVRGRRLWKLVTDRAEQIEAVRHDPRRVPQLAASDLEDRLPRSARARGEMPAAGVGSAHPDGEIAVEGKDHRNLGRGGRKFLEARIAARYEGQIRHWQKSKQDSDRRVNSPRDRDGGGTVLAVRRAAPRPAETGRRR